MIPVEKYFDEFVKDLGGVKVSEQLANKPEFKHGLPDNADYLFPNDDVIAELKCLEEDTYSPEEFSQLLGRLYITWQDKGLIQEERFGRTLLQTKDLPLDCQLEVEKLVNKRLRKVIAKANKQIRITKDVLGMPDAKGILLLVSDGNYFLQPNQVIGFAGRILKSHFSNIHSLIYFTVNMTVQMQTINRDSCIWIEGFREGVEKVSPEFLKRLSEGWISFLAVKTGENIPVYDVQDHNLIDSTKFTREIYVATQNESGVVWRPVQATLEFSDVYRIITLITKARGWQFSCGDMVRCRNHTFKNGKVGLIAFEKYDDVVVTIGKDKFGQRVIKMQSTNSEKIEERIVVPNIKHKFYALSLAASRRIDTNTSELAHEASSAQVNTPEEAYEKGYTEARLKWPESEGWSHSVMIQEVNLNIRVLLQQQIKE
jgi:hypothetical protein